MRIRAVRAVSRPMASGIANAFIDFSKMTTTVVAVVADGPGGRPVVGYGFNSNGRYSAEALMRERFIPRLLGAEPGSLVDPQHAGEGGAPLLCPFRCWDAMMRNEKPGGHGERSVAVGTLDMALWDAVAKAAGQPLWRLLSERYNGGAADERVWVYAAGGYYYPGKGASELTAEMRSYLDRGFRDVKMKIGGANRAPDLTEALRGDVERIEAVLRVLPPGCRLAVDANGRFDLPAAAAYGEALRAYQDRLLWYEEAGDPLDYALQAELSRQFRGGVPMATGENLFSTVDARNLLRYGGMDPERDWLQFDCALSYGLVEYLRTLAAMEAEGWSRRRLVPHGGHQMSLAIAAGLQLGGNEAYPDVFQPFSGFADHMPVVDGHIAVDDAPGVGFEANRSLFDVMREIPTD